MTLSKIIFAVAVAGVICLVVVIVFILYIILVILAQPAILFGAECSKTRPLFEYFLSLFMKAQKYLMFMF